MEINEKMAREIASQLGLTQEMKKGMPSLKNMENKSDLELTREILEIKEKLRKNNISYEKQAAIARSLMPMMNENQKARLEKIIELLK